MAYGLEMGRARVQTRIVHASEKVVTCLITGCTAEFSKLTVSDDMVLGDKLSALVVTGVSLEASRVRATSILIIPTGVSGKFGRSLVVNELFFDDQEKVLSFFDGATLRSHSFVI